MFAILAAWEPRLAEMHAEVLSIEEPTWHEYSYFKTKLGRIVGQNREGLDGPPQLWTQAAWETAYKVILGSKW